MSLPDSDACFVKGYPAETTAAFCDGHVSAFAFFGGVPQSILYDNTKIAVARILGTSPRSDASVHRTASRITCLMDRFGRPARGNDKGNVEGMVGYTRRNLMVPAPCYDSFDDLNAHLEAKCLARQGDTLRGHSQNTGERLVADLDALMGLPVAEYEACDHVSTRATSISMVRYRGNDYSVPVAYAHHDVHVRGFVHEVIIGCGNEVIARHKRSYASADMIFDPIHFLPLIEQKVGALDQAAPLQGWDLPDVFATLHRLLEARMGKPGKREYVQVLRLLETFEIDVVQGAISHAIDLGAIGYDAVKHLVLCRVEKRPPRLDWTSPLSTKSKCWNNAPVQLHEPGRRDCCMTEAPQILLKHHLKQLRLPTFQGEYAKQAQLCAAENKDHIQYLARLCEMELIDRERRMIERRIKAARFPSTKSLDSFDFKIMPSLNKPLPMELVTCSPKTGPFERRICSLNVHENEENRECASHGLAKSRLFGSFRSMRRVRKCPSCAVSTVCRMPPFRNGKPGMAAFRFPMSGG